MSEETKPETTATPVAEEKPKAKRVCKRKAAGETSKKPAAKKTATKKVTAKKTAPKKATAAKKLVKKATKPAQKAVKAATKTTKKTATKKKSSTEKKVKKETKKSFNKFETFVAEAIKAIATEEKPYVSYSKVKQYLLDYMPGGLVTVIPKMTKKTLNSLAEQKLLKAKKESFAFTKKGEEKLAPAKVEKRKKIDRPTKEKKEKPVEKEEPPKTVKTMSGRISKQTAF